MIEEPLQPEAQQEVVDPPAAEPTPEEKRAATLASLPDMLRSTFEGEHDEEELEAVAEGFTPERLKSLPATARVAMRAFLKAEAATEAKRTEAATKRDSEHAARVAKLDQDAKALRQREAAILALAKSDEARDPGAAPDVDPFTPEGIRALAQHEGRKGTAAALAPLRARAIEVDRQQAWEGLVDSYPDLKDPAIVAEFDAFVVSQNEGVDLAKGDKPRMTTPIAARVFFNERAVAAMTAEKEAKRSREATDRAEAARSIARAGTGGGGGDPCARYDQLYKTDKDAAHALLESDPVMRAAVFARAKRAA